MKYLINKLTRKRIWKKIFYERLTEPIHLNLISLFFFFFGSYRKKIEYDLVVRAQHAFSILEVADFAKNNNIETVSLVEFGVASGSGLMNIAEIAKKVSKITGISFKIYGFDTGKGMPKPESHKDHPEYYLEGDFAMNLDLLQKNLPDNVELVIGNVNETIDSFKKKISKDEPIGFISFDLDYYSSTKSAFKILTLEPQLFLPLTYLYFDDIVLPNHNENAGELLAIKEFNIQNELRRIEYHRFLENKRVFRRASWIKQIFYFHVMDNPLRSNLTSKKTKKVLENPYLSYKENVENFKV